MAVYFWVRTPRLADGLDQRLLAALGPWLRRAWRIEHALFVTVGIVHSGASRLRLLHPPARNAGVKRGSP